MVILGLETSGCRSRPGVRAFLRLVGESVLLNLLRVEPRSDALQPLISSDGASSLLKNAI
jgi:hypothetical protein